MSNVSERSVFSITLTLPFFLMCAVQPARAAVEAEFDPSFLQRTPGRGVIDISRFTHGNPVPPGRYNVDVWLNGELRGRTDLEFADVSNTGNAALCMTRPLLDMADPLPQAVKVYPEDDKCLPVSESVPSARVKFDISTLRVDMEIPQALLTPRPRGYVPSSSWQRGVPAALVRYDVSHWQHRSPDTRESRQSWLGVNAGVNLAGWALRHRGSVSRNDSESGRWQSTETNIQRPLPFLRAALTVGDYATGGEIMESVSLRGIRLASDDRMLPGSLRGYAPVVRGMAYSNARVTIRQGGNVIYETTVPAGPFNIGDLYPSGYGGDLNVTVTEADGSSRTFSVPFSSVAQLLRPGYSRWQLAAGRYRYGSELYDDTVFQGTLQYGLVNDVTLNGGVTAAPHYGQVLTGTAVNTPVGAFATDVTMAKTTFVNSGATRKGYSLHASYSTRLSETDTNITLAAYRYSSRDYYSLRDAVRANNSDFIDDVNIRGAAFWRPRNQFQLSVNQSLGEGLGSLYMTGSTFQYWGRAGQQSEYQAGYSNYWKRLSYQVGYSRSRDARRSGRQDDRVWLNVSLPLGNGIQGSATFSTAGRGGGSVQTSLSGTGGEYNQYTWGVSAGSQSGDSLREDISSWSASGGWRSPWSSLTMTAGSDSRHNRQMSLGASGAVVAHPHGVTLSNDLGDTFTVIHAEGAGGATVLNSNGNRLDIFGNGVVPWVTPYEKNRVGIDPQNLPDDVEFSATEQEVIPEANSVTLVTLGTRSGKGRLFEVSLPDGSEAPMAAEVTDEAGNSVGWIAQGGRLFARGLPEQGRLRVMWGPGEKERCFIQYAVTGKFQPDGVSPAVHPVVCGSQTEK